MKFLGGRGAEEPTVYGWNTKVSAPFYHGKLLVKWQLVLQNIFWAKLLHKTIFYNMTMLCDLHVMYQVCIKIIKYLISNNPWKKFKDPPLLSNICKNKA